MRRPYAPALMCFVAVLVWSAIPWSQNSVDERESVLASLTLLYGKPIDNAKVLFSVTSDYVLKPVFSDGLLVAISIEPKPKLDGRDSKHSVQLSKGEFDSILANLNSIKPLGAFEENFGAQFVHGGRASGSQRYRNAYLETTELAFHEPPAPISVASIYYLHPVTGTAKFSRDFRVEDANSFGLVCIGGAPYIAPKEELLKLWSNRTEPQTVQLAGPTRSNCETVQ